MLDKIKRHAQDGAILEEHLADIIAKGGDVKWSKNADSGMVEVLWIQTLAMKTDLPKSRPQAFQCDTTFQTNREVSRLIDNCYFILFFI